MGISIVEWLRPLLESSESSQALRLESEKARMLKSCLERDRNEAVNIYHGSSMIDFIDGIGFLIIVK